MSVYTYEIQYKPTEEYVNTDMLFRLPVGPDTTYDSMESLNIVGDMIQDKHFTDFSCRNSESLKEDKTLKQLITMYAQNGWPNVKRHLSIAIATL